MKKLLGLVGMLVLFSANAVAESTVVLTTHNLRPYGYFDDKARFVGRAVDVVRCAIAKTGRALDIEVSTWQEAQDDVRSGRAHGFFAASRNATRDRYAILSETIAAQDWTWYLPVSSPLDPASESFRLNATVSSFKGANMQKWLMQNDFRLIEEPPADSRRLFLMLMNERLDAILANNLVIEDLIRQNDVAGHFKNITLKEKPLGVYFSKTFLAGNDGFLETFNAGIRECRPS